MLAIKNALKQTVRLYCSKKPPEIMKYLCVAEKNDAAKNIAGFLSRGTSTRREGLSPYNKIYEFDCQVRGQNATIIMTSVSGHLLNYAFQSNFKNWQSCNPAVLFDAPISKVCPDDYQNIKRTLEREVRKCGALIIWTDCDREGENIGFEIIKVCTDLKPNLPLYRAKFSEITSRSIHRALNNLEQPNRNVSNAVDVRMELDLRTGAAFTRLQTLRLQKVFPRSLSQKLISYGSCQFPTLGFVVERYQDIENFIPEMFWKIIMNHVVKDLKTDFLWKRVRLFDKQAVEAILDICLENQLATIESVESKPKSKWRPLPLDTVEMEKTISKKLRINAKEVMKVAEKLYTQGLISYPRTETNIFPKELNLQPLVEQQCNDHNWGNFANRILNEGGPNPRQGKKTDQAHPPIHPTKYANNLQGNEQRIYEYIVRHFLACVSKDALGHETIVQADIAGEKFTAKGLMILERNYLDVYIYERWNAKEINQYQIGDTFTPTVLEIVESSTTAPQLLTEADLIALMEKHGIGTDATHAEHIETIKSREYVGLHDNLYFVPATLGMGLVEGYNKIGLEISLAKPTLRADFENDLKLVCEGRKDAETVRREQVEKYKEVFTTVATKMRLIDTSLASRLNDNPEDFIEDTSNYFKSPFKCPLCGSDMILRQKKSDSGKFLSCSNYPNCKNAIWFMSDVVSVDVMDEHCRTCGPDYKKLKIKFRHNPFVGEPNPNILCIAGCDAAIMATLDIQLSKVKQSANHTVAPVETVRNTNPAPRPPPPPQQINRSNNMPVRNNTSNRSNDSGFSERTSWNSNNQNNRPINSSASGSFNSNNSFNNNVNSTNIGDDVIVCHCDKQAKLLTVRKEGPNQGKQFYKCETFKDNGGCDFFAWADEPTANNLPRQNNNQNQNAALKCDCHQDAVLKTVRKEGNNTGRQFYCCPKPQGEGCKFFKWADEVNQNDGGGDDWGGGGPSWGGGNDTFRGKARGRGKGRSRGGGGTSRPAPYNNKTKTKRKCGLCGQEGHTRNKCPNA